MALGEGKDNDFYEVMGLEKECSAGELRNAYKKLAMRWHPDRCSASKNEEAKTKFQAIQEAYSVLSDTNKRLLYDIGIREEDDEENAMADFLGEMTTMMREDRSSEKKVESFQDLQDLFKETFRVDANGSFVGDAFDPPSSWSSPSSCDADSMFCNVDGDAAGYNLKRNRADMASGRSSTVFTTSSVEVEPPSHFDADHQRFFSGVVDPGWPSSGRVGDGQRRTGRRQKVSSRHDVSSPTS